MAEKPCQLWRDSRNNRIYKVAWDRCTKINMGTLEGAPAVDFEQDLLNIAGSNWGAIAPATSSKSHAWLDSIPTVV